MFGQNSKSQEDIQAVKQRVLARFPLLGVTMMDLPIVAKYRKVETACTNGTRVYYNPKFFEKLSDDQKEFTLAHEVMHIAFNHILRSKNRDHELWNIATDAVINQMLSKEGLPIKPGFVDIKWAGKYSAEEVYDILLKKKQGKGEDDNQFDNGNVDKANFKSHSMWKKAIKKAERQQQSGSVNFDEQKNQEQNSSGNQSQNQGSNKAEQKQPQSQFNKVDQSQDYDVQNQPEQEQSQDKDAQKGQEQSNKKSLWNKLKEVVKEVKDNQKGDSQEKEAAAPKDENMDAYEKRLLGEKSRKTS